MFTMTVSLVALPVNAQVNWEGHAKSYAFIGAVPNPATVGEEVLLHVGITQQLQITQDKWYDLSVTITDPDGHDTTMSGIDTDATGGTGRVFTPDKEGTYLIQTHFPAQWYNFS